MPRPINYSTMVARPAGIWGCRLLQLVWNTYIGNQWLPINRQFRTSDRLTQRSVCAILRMSFQAA